MRIYLNSFKEIGNLLFREHNSFYSKIDFTAMVFIQ